MGPIERTSITSNVVNDHDHSAVLTICAAFCMACCLSFLTARLLIRWPWTSLFGKDDYAIIAATVFAIVQESLTMYATYQGLGKVREDMSDIESSKVQQLVYATDLLFVLTCYTSKLAVSLFFVRLCSSRLHIALSGGITVACGVAFGISVLILAIEPPYAEPWASVIAQYRLGRWIAVEVLNNLLDLAIIAFPIYFVRELQMSKAMKAKVVTGFGLRFPLIPISIVRLVVFAKTTKSSKPFFDFVTPEILLQAEMAYGVVSATIPCLRIFLQAASSGMLGGGILDPTGTQLATKGANFGGSYKLSTLKSNRSHKDDGGLQLVGRRHGETITRATQAGAEDKISMASDSSQRAIMFLLLGNFQLHGRHGCMLTDSYVHGSIQSSFSVRSSRQKHYDTWKTWEKRRLQSSK